MINYYFDNTNELRPFTHELEANDDTLPPDNALRIAPKFKDDYWPCEQNGAWILIEDNRNKTVYNINTKESSTVDYFGKIKEEFTLLVPFEFCMWNGKKWVLDEDAKNEHLIKNNQNLKNSLINEANEKIAVLQDIIDLDMQEADEEAQLKQWKKYRILVTRVDVSDINAVFPKKPQ
ncbi:MULTISPECIES: tail fiber assembly protein [unclassified Gilliamella]|uniref:tail fiber assembly protein n=1 Tax=unclassified Gilliamella TaxID=2685620 RepID=UPI001307302A|nr:MULTISPECIES: tail fiber assembly protein [unclassified Gilliamella]MWP48507.1 tail fiber assembly protein [Gilliamella sp. Lep-s35]MWP68569.1 tail fiber assembly protein [Gilliamella sp. Lep-s5]MWP76763.1 tail fiber assembly protein [Gilliamella sp. Lep-s21]